MAKVILRRQAAYGGVRDVFLEIIQYFQRIIYFIWIPLANFFIFSMIAIGKTL
ncbi:hypothetical protein NEILACOT_03031 [Neisseria lactamica ATCC 23970]|uniref:Uncharacterized protein n=1 Tax=Neisseria lactamica ATCC 23970 TaxID=546265 RepID=D0W695_NEILA|nr:hypothetical protein NEILACOT_03031 [Neisseria lactamica ATCC 23970]